MAESAAIVLAGGRSSRMGSPKAALDWHGSTLLRRITGIVGRAVDGPVVVVGAPGQELPPVGEAVEFVADAREGRGPLEGLAAGLAAIGDRARTAFLSATDVPLLHPAFVRCVLGSLGAGDDVALPEVGGYRQPLAAAYRLDLLATVAELLAAERLRPAFLFERCAVKLLPEVALLADPVLAALDPQLDSLLNLNAAADYERSRALPAPAISVERFGALAPPSGPRRATVRAWSLGAAAGAVGVALGRDVVAALNGERVAADPQLPLTAGDVVGLLPADGGGTHR